MPFTIGIQTPWQKEQMFKHGHQKRVSMILHLAQIKIRYFLIPWQCNYCVMFWYFQVFCPPIQHLTCFHFLPWTSFHCTPWWCSMIGSMVYMLCTSSHQIQSKLTCPHGCWCLITCYVLSNLTSGLMLSFLMMQM